MTLVSDRPPEGAVAAALKAGAGESDFALKFQDVPDLVKVGHEISPAHIRQRAWAV